MSSVPPVQRGGAARRTKMFISFDPGTVCLEVRLKEIIRHVGKNEIFIEAIFLREISEAF